MKKINELRNKGANCLAYCIESVGVQYGERVTDAIPGLSWHQWGEAVDCFWVVNKKAEWSITKTVDGLNGYMLYADEAKKLGLEAGLYWQNLVDGPHVQLRKGSSPLKLMTLNEIDQQISVRFPYPGYPV